MASALDAANTLLTATRTPEGRDAAVSDELAATLQRITSYADWLVSDQASAHDATEAECASQAALLSQRIPVHANMPQSH